MSENSTVGTIVTEVIWIAGTIVVVYGAGYVVKRGWRAGKALKAAKFSR